MNIKDYIHRTHEIDELQKKSEHVKTLHKSISWEPTFDKCLFELKTSELMSHADAISLLNKIKMSEKPVNHDAYSIMKSRNTPDKWRVIISLEIYTQDSEISND